MRTVEQLRAEQEQRARSLLETLAASNAFYRSRWADRRPEGDTALEQLSSLPLLTKEELVADQAANPPYGSNFTRPLADYVRVHQTSGTKGAPLLWLDTGDSWQWFLDGWADVFRAAGIGSGDRIFFAFSFGPFIGFWAAFECCRQLGAMALSGGSLSTDQRLDAIGRHQATVLVSTPTYALRLAEAARARGTDLVGGSITRTLHAGEPGASLPAVRARLEAAYGARCYDHAGATEIGPWGLPGQDDFMLINERHYVAELVDPATGELLEPREGGTRGELVLTNLGRACSPVLRYRTGDLVEMWPPGSGGPPFARLRGGVLARADDMVVVRGVNVYPSAIESLVRQVESELEERFGRDVGWIEEYRVEVVRDREMSALALRVESLHPRSEELAAALRSRLHDALSLRVDVELAEPGSLPRFELKARRFHVRDGE